MTDGTSRSSVYMNDMVVGQYSSRVGEKSRVAFPKRFRQVLGDTLIVTYGFEGSLIIVAENNWHQLLSGTEDKPFLLSTARDTKRFLLGGATVVELDAQGRFIIPEYLKKFAQIEEDVTFVGQDKYVEVWSQKRWNEYNESMQKDINTIVEKLVNSIEKQ